MTPSATYPLRIGTRSSPLAMAQAEMTKAALLAAHGWDEAAVLLVPMLASGDKIQDRPLAEIGGKALWTKELERALIEREVDIAVHSMKDVETIRPDVFRIAAMLPRADTRDRLIGAESIAALPKGARVGTSSPRRAAQLKALRTDIVTATIRGNVATRLARLANGEFDATLLAAAGLNRLGQSDVGHPIAKSEMLPAASQGAIGIDCLSERFEVAELLTPINHQPTFDCVMAERVFLAALGGTCRSPVAAQAEWSGDALLLKGEILREDGSERQQGETTCAPGDGKAPAELARKLLATASPELQALFEG
jgi:hydroxymethylbilane synthase